MHPTELEATVSRARAWLGSTEFTNREMPQTPLNFNADFK